MAGEKMTGPLSEGEVLSELDTIFTQRTVRVSVRRTSPLWKPPTDVIETEDSVIITVEVAGMSSGDFTVALHQHILSISGARPGKSGSHAFHQMEIHYGEFRTDIELPAAVQPDTVEASYVDGFLHVVMRKRTRDTIPVSEK